jgi:phosphatidylserine decarboxylase
MSKGTNKGSSGKLRSVNLKKHKLYLRNMRNAVKGKEERSRS